MRVMIPPEAWRASRSALLAPRMRADQCRIAGHWYSAPDLPSPTEVEAINHYGRHVTEVGGVIDLYAAVGQAHLASVEVMRLTLTTLDDLTPVQVGQLGAPDLDALRTGWAGALAGNPCWLIEYVRIIE